MHQAPQWLNILFARARCTNGVVAGSQLTASAYSRRPYLDRSPQIPSMISMENPVTGVAQAVVVVLVVVVLVVV